MLWNVEGHVPEEHQSPEQRWRPHWPAGRPESRSGDVPAGREGSAEIKPNYLGRQSKPAQLLNYYKFFFCRRIQRKNAPPASR